MGQKLYEYAAIYTPLQTKEQNDRGEKPKSELIVKPTPVLADGEAEVRVVASRAIPDGYSDRLAQIDLVVRDF